jgi:opacity protein-like surface antigen
MKVRNACLFSGLAMGLGMSAPADAADWGSRGETARVYSGGAQSVPAVPVPAPVPIPEYNGGWYIRLDAGIGMIGEPSISESGFIYGENDGPGPIGGPADARYLSSSWFDNDFRTFATLGGGVGYDFGRGWRMDATVEKRTMNKMQINGTDSWNTYGYDTTCAPCTTYGIIDANGDGAPDSKTTFHVSDVAKIDGTVWMANLYYDLFTTRGFTPYIGAGAGFMWNVVSRHHESEVTQCDLTAVPACATQASVSSVVAGSDADKITLAAAAMAGVSYELTDITTLDVGYRYLYMGGTQVSTDINGHYSTIKFGDQSVHQVRAGLRFNFN